MYCPYQTSSVILSYSMHCHLNCKTIKILSTTMITIMVMLLHTVSPEYPVHTTRHILYILKYIHIYICTFK